MKSKTTITRAKNTNCVVEDNTSRFAILFAILGSALVAAVPFGVYNALRLAFSPTISLLFLGIVSLWSLAIVGRAIRSIS